MIRWWQFLRLRNTSVETLCFELLFLEKGRTKSVAKQTRALCVIITTLFLGCEILKTFTSFMKIKRSTANGTEQLNI